jgi:uncharacterized protein DUF4232
MDDQDWGISILSRIRIRGLNRWASVTRTFPVIITGLALAACGGPAQPAQGQPASTTLATSSVATDSSKPTSSPADGTTTTSATTGSATACSLQQVRITISGHALADVEVLPDPSRAATTLVMTNTSDETCTVDGYGTFQLTDEHDQPLPTTFQHRTGDPAHLVTLAPGTTAVKYFEWSIQTGPDAQTCADPAGLVAYPFDGDNEQRVNLTWTIGAYCGPFTDGPWGAEGNG